VLGFLSMLRNA